MNQIENIVRANEAAKKTDDFCKLKTIEEKIFKLILKDIEINRKTDLAIKKEIEISELTESICNQNDKIKEQQLLIANSQKYIASGELSSGQYLTEKNELCKKEKELSDFHELLLIQNRVLPIMVEEISELKRERNSFIENIGQFIFDEKINEIANAISDELLTLLKVIPANKRSMANVPEHFVVKYGHAKAMEAIMLKVLDGRPVPDQNQVPEYIASLVLNTIENNAKYGKVTTKDGISVTIVQQPYIEGTPEYSYYKAAGIDSDCNEYVIQWDCVEGWQDIEDETKRYNFDDYDIKSV